MPGAGTNVQLAWATPIDPVTLTTHLSAQFEVQAAFDTLRLCNRYGKGDHATVTKLPV